MVVVNVSENYDRKLKREIKTRTDFARQIAGMQQIVIFI